MSRSSSSRISGRRASPGTADWATTIVILTNTAYECMNLQLVDDVVDAVMG
jgi:hypothetical protein